VKRKVVCNGGGNFIVPFHARMIPEPGYRRAAGLAWTLPLQSRHGLRLRVSRLAPAKNRCGRRARVIESISALLRPRQGLQNTFVRTFQTFSFATLLTGNGEDVKTVQESLRHADSKMTLEAYFQGLMPAKRGALRKRCSRPFPSEFCKCLILSVWARSSVGRATPF
jgi:integrase